MQSRRWGRLSLGLMILVAGVFLLCAGPRPLPPIGNLGQAPTLHSSQAGARLSEVLGKLPLSFELNYGQTDADVKFLAHGLGSTMFLTGRAETVLVLQQRGDVRRRVQTNSTSVLPVSSLLCSLNSSNLLSQGSLLPVQSALELTPSAQASVLRISLAGASASPRVEGVEALVGKANYFIGGDPAKWRTNVPTFARVRFSELYPGIDLVYYGNHQQLEYDFLVHPGADPGRIAFNVQGALSLEVDATGDLVLHTVDGPIRQRKPIVRQEVNGVRKEISGGYVFTGTHQVSFQIGPYDTSQLLIIDPVLSYSTYLGGNNFEQGIGIAVDATGNAYVTGFTNSANYPTTAGASQTTYGGGGDDVFVTKLDPTGSSLLYSTYLGGSGTDAGEGIAVDATANAYVAGFTTSTNFPTTAGAFQSTAGGGGEDGFVAKLNSSGGGLVYSTYLGGGGIDAATGIAADTAGNAYVSGGTLSINFPTTPGALQTTLGGSEDAFVSKLNPGGSGLVYSTYLGGSGSDETAGIAVDATGNAYVGGFTTSGNFPTTAGAVQTAFGGIADAFVTKLNAAGSAPAYSTYLGGSNADVGRGIVVDAAGNAYVTGFTNSANFPTTAGSLQTTYGGGSADSYVTKLNPAGSGLVFSTYLGGSGVDTGGWIAVDVLGNIHVTGLTSSVNFPTTAGAFQTAYGGGAADAFVTEINPGGSALLDSTFLGGDSFEQGLGIAVDDAGSSYVTGMTTSSNFPTTAGAFQTAFGGQQDAFVIKTAKVAAASCPAPVIDGLAATPSILWPPDHNLAGVTIDYDQTSPCSATCTLSVSSSEPANGQGDGTTSPDWQVIDAHHVLLRAERAGAGAGRIYTITLSCVNSGGDSSSASVSVTVPHDRGQRANK